MSILSAGSVPYPECTAYGEKGLLARFDRRELQKRRDAGLVFGC